MTGAGVGDGVGVKASVGVIVAVAVIVADGAEVAVLLMVAGVSVKVAAGLPEFCLHPTRRKSNIAAMKSFLVMEPSEDKSN